MASGESFCLTTMGGEADGCGCLISPEATPPEWLPLSAPVLTLPSVLRPCVLALQVLEGCP